jgi:hypothetical protein
MRYLQVRKNKTEEAFYSLLQYRQFISEFGPAEMPVYFLNTKGEHQEHNLGRLLPFSFALQQGEKYLI